VETIEGLYIILTEKGHALKSAKRIHGKVISLEIGSICGALLDDPKTLVPTTVASSRFHPERTTFVTWI